MSNELAEGFLRTLTQHRGPGGASLCFDTTALGELQLDSIRASPGRITAVLPVTPAVANRYGTLHGGCIATLVDTVGSAALVTLSPKGGVSLNINVNYLSKVSLGGSVLVEAEVVRVGQRIATIDVRLKDAATGALVAQGTHVKYIAESEPTMAELIEKSRQERAVALAGGEAGPAAAAAGGLAAAGAAGGQGSQQQGEQGVLQWLHGSAGPRSKL